MFLKLNRLMSQAGSYGSGGSGGGGITTINGDVGSVTGPTITLTGGTSGAVFTGVGTTMTESFEFLALPTTTATDGQIKINGNPFMHNYDGSVYLGVNAGNFTASTGDKNIGIGNGTLASVISGENNTAIGPTDCAIAITTGINNTVIGGYAATNLETGGSNVAIGDGALYELVSGDSNIAIGPSAGISYTTNESSNICIGNPGTIADSGVVRIGTNATHTSTYIAGIEGVDVGNVAKVVTVDADQLGSATITAGTGISVTPTANTITIANTSVAGTQAFSYYLNSTVSNVIGNSGPYTILFDTALISNSNYNSGTGRFTAPANGVYYFSAGCLVTNVAATASTTFNLVIAKNNAGQLVGTYLNPTTVAAAGDYFGSNSSGIIVMSAGDYIEIQVTMAGGGGNTSGVLGGNGFTYFNGFRVA